jgi:hypothetical protein
VTPACENAKRHSPVVATIHYSVEDKRNGSVKILVSIGFILSFLGIGLFLAPRNLLYEYSEISRTFALIITAIGWALSTGSLAFQLGMKSQKGK